MFQVSRKVIETNIHGAPHTWIQLVEMLPSSSIYVWASNSGSCPSGNLTLAVPVGKDTATTDLVGVGSIDDLSRRMSRILSKRYQIQAFCSVILQGEFPNDPEIQSAFTMVMGAVRSMIEEQKKNSNA
ncbi:hypothetical protein SPOG_03244 [Schizosaccharomyces cryophilus OY26]|uniref:Proteasome assembly chaperone 4 n=1 Tax=Schizosaccharomyces cryophilus (strain OY26 / ATCC MYA-4695 / CBS 11777 / NBRC 106824 / NRRL Y48691) TaxID=653667 RepID=S9VUB7_SCHCR|nr:uncharacterized protein SPOG_03244 [Schizosaccharomyces cryophilus OY26]EPY49769.1 hypothetical protein SPOG_03244 [Schizosaccharomyces cryophilus OY26]